MPSEGQERLSFLSFMSVVERSGLDRIGLLEAAMGDTQDKRQHVRKLLERRLDSYYEALMEAARRETRERWERLIKEGDHGEARA